MINLSIKLSISSTMKIPTTHLKPILVNLNENENGSGNVSGGGIEYKGKLYASHAQSDNIVLSSEELWFIAKVNEKRDREEEGVKEITYLSKIWATKKMFGCGYSEEIEKTLRACHEDLYCL